MTPKIYGESPDLDFNPDPEAVRQERLGTMGDVERGVRSGIHQVGAGFAGMGALVSDVVGAEDLKEKAMDTYRTQTYKASQFPGKIESVLDVKGPGDFADWAQYTAGQLLPTMAETVATTAATGGLGSLASKTALKGYIKKRASDQVGKELLKGTIKKELAGKATKELEKKLTDTIVKNSAKSGMIAGTLPLESGSMYGELLESHGVNAPGTAMFFGSIASAFELMGGNSRIVDSLAGAVMRGDGPLIKQIAKSMYRGAKEESRQEGYQGLMSILNKVANTDEKLLTPEHLEEIINAMAAGSLPGLGGGAVVGLRSKPKQVQKTIVDQTEEFVDEVEPEYPDFSDEIKRQLSTQSQDRQPTQEDARIQELRESNQQQIRNIESAPSPKGATQAEIEKNIDEFRRVKQQEKEVMDLEERRDPFQQGLRGQGRYLSDVGVSPDEIARTGEDFSGRSLPGVYTPVPEIRNLQDAISNEGRRIEEQFVQQRDFNNQPEPVYPDYAPEIQAQRDFREQQRTLQESPDAIRRGKTQEDIDQSERVLQESERQETENIEKNQTLVDMNDQYQGTETRGFTYDENNKRNYYPASTPGWMKEVNRLSREGGDKNISRTEFKRLVEREVNNEPLTEKQETKMSYIKKAMGTFETEQGSDFNVQEEVNDLEEKGYEFQAPEKIVAADLKPGQKFFGTVDGIKDEYTVVGDEAGNVVIKDGIKHRVDLFDSVEIEARLPVNEQVKPVVKESVKSFTKESKAKIKQQALDTKSSKQGEFDFDFKPVKKAKSKNIEQIVEKATGKPAKVKHRRTIMLTTGNMLHSGKKAKDITEVASLLSGIRKSPQEEMYGVTTDKKGNILEIHRYGKGTKGSASVDPVELGGHALSVDGASNFYFFHNHPSGSLTPSMEDMSIHKRLRGILRTKGISLTGGIIGGKQWSAFDDKGQLSGSADIKPIVRNTRIPIKERSRVIPTGEKKIRISSPEDIGKIIKGKKDGFALFDNQLNYVGWVDFPKGKRINEIASTLIQASERTSGNRIIFNNVGKISTERQEFLGDFFKGSGLDLLDVVEQGEPIGNAIRPDGSELSFFDGDEILNAIGKKDKGTKPVTLKEVKTLFKNQEVTETKTGYDVNLQNGETISIETHDAGDLEKVGVKINFGKGKSRAGWIDPGSKEFKINLVNNIADRGVLAHETMHIFEQAGMVTPKEITALNFYIKGNKLGKTFPKGTSLKTQQIENRAYLMQEYLSGRLDVKASKIKSILQKIGDMIDKLYRAITRKVTVRGFAKEVESGKVYKRKKGKSSLDSGEKQSLKDSHAVDNLEKYQHIINNATKGSTIKVNDNYSLSTGYSLSDKYVLLPRNGKVAIKIFPTKKTLLNYLENGIDIKYTGPQKTAKKIPVKDIGDSEYKGRDMHWSESMEPQEVTKKDMVAYHYSDEPIKSFANIETSFFTEGNSHNYTKNGYEVSIPKGSTVQFSTTGEEVRYVLNKNSSIYKLKKGFSKFKNISTGRDSDQNILSAFTGEASKTADKKMLERAKKMNGLGYSEDKIRQLTKWFKGMDNKWRYEIDDSVAKFKTNKMAKNGIYELGKVVDHPELFKAHPELKGIRVQMTDLPGKNLGMTTTTKDGKAIIKLNNKYRNKPRILMHEIQHLIQFRNKFAGGGTIEGMTYEEYRNLAGEVESVDVSDRLDFTPEERLKTAPKRVDKPVVKLTGKKLKRMDSALNAFATDDSYYDDILREKKDYAGKAKTGTENLLRGIKKGADKYLGSISTRLGNISPKLKYALRNFENKIGMGMQKNIDAVSPMLKKAKKAMSSDDFKRWDVARKNSDKPMIDNLIKKHDLEKEYNAYRKMMDSVRKEAEDVGLDVGYIEDYTPRVLKDVEGFLKAIGKDPQWDVITRRLKARAKELGLEVDEMSQDQRADLVSNMLLGGGTGLSGIPSTKERKIKTIPAHLDKFYMDSDAAIITYLDKMRKGIEARRFFGKVPAVIKQAKMRVNALNKRLRLTNDIEMQNDIKADIREYQDKINRYKYQRDYTHNIGAYVDELREKKEIAPGEEQDLIDILSARFHEKGTHGVTQAYKNFSYIDTMGSFTSAITQIGDLAWSMYENGIIPTLKHTAKAAVGKSIIKKEDLGLSHVAQEFSDATTLGKAVSTVFKLTGLEKMDSIGKESLINSTFDKYSEMAKQKPDALKSEIKDIFGDQTDSVIKDMQEGKVTGNTKLLVYHKVLDFQPMALSEMPEKYLTAGNGRIFYMLKTFTLKQFDIFRREAFQKIASGNKKEKIQGLKNLVMLSSFFVAANATADELKDLLLGRETDLDDRVIDNMLRLGGISKFVTWKARTEGVGSAMAKQILPPFKFIDSITKDITHLGDNKGLETMSSVPLVGKLYSWHAGRGSKKRGDLWDRRWSSEKKDLTKINEGLKKSKNKFKFRRENIKKLNRYNRMKANQKKLNSLKKKINKLKSKKETKFIMKSIKRLEESRTKIITDFLK